MIVTMMLMPITTIFGYWVVSPIDASVDRIVCASWHGIKASILITEYQRWTSAMPAAVMMRLCCNWQGSDAQGKEKC
jgi:hypothetical protein